MFDIIENSWDQPPVINSTHKVIILSSIFYLMLLLFLADQFPKNVQLKVKTEQSSLELDETYIVINNDISIAA